MPVGPSIPPHPPPSKEEEEEPSPAAEFGPQIPPHTSARSPSRPRPPLAQEEEEEEDDDDDDDYAPALPPDMLAARTSGPTPASSSRPVVGPSLPPHLARRRARAEEEEEDDDDDDDYGPRPLPQGVVLEESDGVKEFLEKEERRRKQIEEAAKPKALKREEWMLVPPTSSDLLSSIDPTKMTRPRQFARSAAPARDADNSLWTETPAERQQRVADEVAGKRRRAADAGVPEEDAESRKRRRHEEEIRRGVEAHTRNMRGGRLLDQHGEGLAGQEQTEEEPAAIWDHSRDMSLGGRLMDDKTRNKFIQEAKGLGERFGTGKSGGFL